MPISYKYKIREKLQTYSKSEQSFLRKIIPFILGKSRRTFDRYCNLKQDDFMDIPVKDLDIIAFILDCSIKSLKNYEIESKQIEDKLKKFNNNDLRKNQSKI